MWDCLKVAFPGFCRAQSGYSPEGRGFLARREVLRLTLSPLGSQGQVEYRVAVLGQRLGLDYWGVRRRESANADGIWKAP